MVTFDSPYAGRSNACLCQRETFSTQKVQRASADSGQAANGFGKSESFLLAAIACHRERPLTPALSPWKNGERERTALSALTLCILLARIGGIEHEGKRSGKTLDIDRVRHDAGDGTV